MNPSMISKTEQNKRSTYDASLNGLCYSSVWIINKSLKCILVPLFLACVPSLEYLATS